MLEQSRFQMKKKAIRYLKRLLFTFCIFFSIVLTLYNCSENISNNQEVVFPDSNVSYLIHVQPFLKFTCGLSNCHNEYYKAADVVLTDYFSLFTSYGGALVFPYKPDQSALIKILEGMEVHLTPIYFRINSNQKRGMRQWILEGAKNN